MSLVSGCGQYDDWADPDPKRYYRDVTNLQKDGIASITKAAPVVEQENKCFNYKKRKCDDSMWGCVGPDVKETTSSCPSAMVEPSHTSKYCAESVSSLCQIIFLLREIPLPCSNAQLTHILSKFHCLIHELYLTNHHSSQEHATYGTSCLPLAFLNLTIGHLSNPRSINLI